MLGLLVKKELNDFTSDEPLQTDPLTLLGEAGYERFLKSLLDKVKRVQKESKQ